MRDYKTSFITSEQLPLVIEPTHNVSLDEFCAWVTANKPFISEQLLKWGGILFRGFPLENADHFNVLVEKLDLGKSLNYVGGDTPRDKVKGKVYTSTEAPPSFKIPLHNEMSFIKHYPKHVYFFCETPPRADGETILADARQVFKGIEERVMGKFNHNGLRYISNFYGRSFILDLVNRFQRAHKTWMDAFETKDKIEVEEHCKQNEFGFKWGINDWLQIIYNAPATLQHPITKENVWFNQAHLYDYNPKLIGFWNWLGTKLIYWRKDTIMHEIYFGDGKKVPRSDLYHIMNVLDEKTVKFPWQKSDLLVLDNILTMHGRAPFSGQRRILAALTR